MDLLTWMTNGSDLHLLEDYLGFHGEKNSDRLEGVREFKDVVIEAWQHVV